jgi:hypothetical protein
MLKKFPDLSLKLFRILRPNSLKRRCKFPNVVKRGLPLLLTRSAAKLTYGDQNSQPRND